MFTVKFDGVFKANPMSLFMVVFHFRVALPLVSGIMHCTPLIHLSIRLSRLVFKCQNKNFSKSVNLIKIIPAAQYSSEAERSNSMSLDLSREVWYSECIQCMADE